MTHPDADEAVPQVVDQAAAWRIIDANANRCLEGLRVVEDQARFAGDDRLLATKCKQLRHQLDAVLEQLSIERRLVVRDTAGDVGTKISTPREAQRNAPADILRAGWKRIQQSLRCLEETSKWVAPPLAPQLEALRYASYTLEKAMLLGGEAPKPGNRYGCTY